MQVFAQTVANLKEQYAVVCPEGMIEDCLEAVRKLKSDITLSRVFKNDQVELMVVFQVASDLESEAKLSRLIFKIWRQIRYDFFNCSKLIKCQNGYVLNFCTIPRNGSRMVVGRLVADIAKNDPLIQGLVGRQMNGSLEPSIWNFIEGDFDWSAL